MIRTTLTPLEALRRLVDEVRLLDADEVGERWNQLQGVLGVAGTVLHEADQPAVGEVSFDALELKKTIEMMVDHRRKGYDLTALIFHAQKLLSAAPLPEAGSAAAVRREQKQFCDEVELFASPAIAAPTEVERDAARLDFMQAHPIMYFNTSKNGKRWRYGTFSNYPQDCFNTIREAIDAAMAQGEKK